MRPSGLVPVSHERRRRRTSPPNPPPSGRPTPIPIPRRSSIFPLSRRPSPRIACLLFVGPRQRDLKVRLFRSVLAASNKCTHDTGEALSYIEELMDLGLRDRVAVVTGSSRGLGLAIARTLASEGCLVCLCGRTESTLEQARRDVAIRAVGDERVIAIAADVSTPDGVKSVIDGTIAAFGGIDILVNNVGLARGATITDTSDAEWQEAFDQTLFPAIRASRLAVPHMKQRGGGSIIIIASVFGREAGG